MSPGVHSWALPRPLRLSCLLWCVTNWGFKLESSVTLLTGYMYLLSRGLFSFSIETKLTKHKVINFILFFIQNMFMGMVSHSSWYRLLLVLLPSAGAAFCKPCFSSCRLAEDSRAANTQNYRLCIAKDSDDFITSWAFHIHEIGIEALHQMLLLAFHIVFWREMREILLRGMFL